MSARRINEITGVDRMVTKRGCRKALNFSRMPARIPKDKASISEMKKPSSPRKMVDPMVLKNSGSVVSWMRLKNVFSGEGKINSEETISEPAFHNIIRKTTEIKVYVLFFVNKFFIW